MHIQFRYSRKFHIIINHSTWNNTGLFHNSIFCNFKLLCICHISDKIITCNCTYLRKFFYDHFPPFIWQHIRRRYINRQLCLRKHLFSKPYQLCHGFFHCIIAFPCFVWKDICIIHIWQAQWLMIISMISQFSSLMKQHIPKILKSLHIFLFHNISGHIIFIIINNNTCIFHTVFLCHIQHIRPPDICIKLFDAETIITFDIFSISTRYRRWKIIQIEYRSIKHRVNHHICQQAIGCRKKSSCGFYT